MPGVVAFGRRWCIATDDFLIAGIIDSIFFLSWLSLSAVIYSNYLEVQCNCDTGPWCHVVNTFLLGSCILYALNALLAIAFIIFGARGTVSQLEPRRHVVTLIYVKAVLSLFDFLWAILGSVLLKYGYCCDHFNADFAFKAITICLWFMFLVRVLMILFSYDPRGRQGKKCQKKVIHNEYLSTAVPAGSVRKWKCRFWAFFFWMTTGSKERRVAINTMAEMAAFLSYDLDLVASDLAAAFYLYRQKSINVYKEEKKALESAAPITLQDGTAVDSFPLPDMPEWMNLKMACHFFEVGLGIFGWAWSLYKDLSCGLCALWKYIVCCLPCRKVSSKVLGDNCCGCRLAGLQVTTKFPYEDLIHVSFVDRVYNIPFYVAIDKVSSSVLITVRGSMSFTDALTDMAASFEPMDDTDCPAGSLCHGGVMHAARRIKQKLEDKNLLEEAFTGKEDFQLVITGHSLGAAVSCALTVMLKYQYPNIRCYAFAPPPIFNSIAVENTEKYIFTLIYGNDVVPFLHHWNLLNMLKDAVALFQQCKMHKYKLLLGLYNSDSEQEKEKLYAKNGQNSYVNDAVVSCKIDVDETDAEKVLNEQPQDVAGHTQFYIPGRILHIRRSHQGYRFQIASPESYSHLWFKPGMVVHHVPNFMLGVLHKFRKEEILHGDSS